MRFARIVPERWWRCWSRRETASAPLRCSPASAETDSLHAAKPIRLASGTPWSEFREQAEIWLPLAAEALDRHGFRLDRDAFLGPGGSYPAVVTGELVVKLFGFAGEWAATRANERTAHERLSLDDRIRAPRLLGSGEIFSGDEHPLPYLILTRIPGSSWCDVPLALDHKLAIATDLGAQLRLVHALPHNRLPTVDTWQIGSAGERAGSGGFPPALAGLVDSWLETVSVAPPVFAHSDIFVRHPFVSDGRLTGIIDWGDVMAADPHVELAKIHLDVFEGDKQLLRALLDAYEWPVDSNFSRRCLAMALRRHAQIHGQHGPGGDVFYRVPELIVNQPIASLDELADVLFGP